MGQYDQSGGEIGQISLFVLLLRTDKSKNKLGWKCQTQELSYVLFWPKSFLGAINTFGLENVLKKFFGSKKCVDP